MSVLKRERGLSNLEFYKNAVWLQIHITFFLAKDFGVRPTTKTVHLVTKTMLKEDADLFNSIAEKYNISRMEATYPEWLVAKLRDGLFDIMSDMMLSITRAYTIFVTNASEGMERRNYINRAIGDCEALLKQMELAVHVINVDLNKYMPIVEKIEYEIMLLKGWRKSGNEKLRKLLNEQSGFPTQREVINNTVYDGLDKIPNLASSTDDGALVSDNKKKRMKKTKSDYTGFPKPDNIKKDAKEYIDHLAGKEPEKEENISKKKDGFVFTVGEK